LQKKPYTQLAWEVRVFLGPSPWKPFRGCKGRGLKIPDTPPLGHRPGGAEATLTQVYCQLVPQVVEPYAVLSRAGGPITPRAAPPLPTRSTAGEDTPQKFNSQRNPLGVYPCVHLESRVPYVSVMNRSTAFLTTNSDFRTGWDLRNRPLTIGPAGGAVRPSSVLVLVEGSCQHVQGALSFRQSTHSMAVWVFICVPPGAIVFLLSKL